ncbi:hypothetical protein BKP45_15695 [Anaerobacillus alkalidiazotrophicus]|uniref:Uncharacterized protein n=1 Tax=Anaerobacillus alkalidiazotrophicus TaxID=472963 RepID=A0A1S2M477_9BACI|nr:YppG family protein [Anaerobacillus alkalidiazotrophicus]OIJ18727.1 hypothetical protein BKP45_15695 [Anaerobacillus alkalidiazotrophicus]
MFIRNQHYPFPLYPHYPMNPYHYQNPYHHPYGYYGQPHPFWYQQNMYQGQNSTPQTNQPGSNPPQGMLTGADGTFDFQKAIKQFDEIMKAANQMSPIMKQIGSLFIKK